MAHWHRLCRIFADCCKSTLEFSFSPLLKGFDKDYQSQEILNDSWLCMSNPSLKLALELYLIGKQLKTRQPTCYYGQCLAHAIQEVLWDLIKHTHGGCVHRSTKHVLCYCTVTFDHFFSRNFNYSSQYHRDSTTKIPSHHSAQWSEVEAQTSEAWIHNSIQNRDGNQSRHDVKCNNCWCWELTIISNLYI